MGLLQKEIKFQVSNDIKKKFSLQKINSALKKTAQSAVDIIVDRTNNNVDIDGKNFAQFTKGYERYKKWYIRRGKKVNAFSAKRMPNNLRLSGELMGSINYKNLTVNANTDKIQIGFNIYIPENQRKKVEGLMSSTGKTRNGKSYRKAKREFFGLSRNPTTAVIEKNKIVANFCKFMGYTVSGAGKDLTIK